MRVGVFFLNTVYIH